jgi:uncharacterized membrane protein
MTGTWRLPYVLCIRCSSIEPAIPEVRRMTSDEVRPQASGHSLDRPMKLADLRGLWQEGLLGDEAYRAARRLLLPKQIWRDWASLHLLFLGTALLLAGIVFFFAYNWEAMDRFLKLGAAALAVVLCALGAQVVGLRTLVGKVLLLSASILVGVLLAVFGQVYQTGADAYELFLAWALLIFLWVLISEFAALWFTWLVVLHCAVIAWWVQVGEPSRVIPLDLFFYSLAVLDGVALASREFFLGRFRDWLGAEWFRSSLALTFLAFHSVPVLVWIFEPDDKWFLGAFSPLIWLAGAVAFFAIYRYRIRDALPLSYLALDISLVFCCFLIERVLTAMSWDSSGAWLLSGLFILCVVGGIAMGLKALIAQMATERAKATGGGTES